MNIKPIDSTGLYNLDSTISGNIIKLNNSFPIKKADHITDLFDFCNNYTSYDLCHCTNKKIIANSNLELSGSVQLNLQSVEIDGNNKDFNLSNGETPSRLIVIQRKNKISNFNFIFNFRNTPNNQASTIPIFTIYNGDVIFEKCSFEIHNTYFNVNQSSSISPGMSSLFDFNYFYTPSAPTFVTFRNCEFKLYAYSYHLYPFTLFRFRNEFITNVSFENCLFVLAGFGNFNAFHFNSISSSYFAKNLCSVSLNNCVFSLNSSNSNHWIINSDNYSLKYYKIKMENTFVYDYSSVNLKVHLRINEKVNPSNLNIDVAHSNIDNFDSQNIHVLKDDFITGTTEPGEIGELGWSTSGNGSIFYSLSSSPINYDRPGVIRMQPTSVNVQFGLHFHNNNTQLIRLNFIKSMKFLASIVGSNGFNHFGIMLALNTTNPDGIYFRTNGTNVYGVVKIGTLTNTVLLGTIIPDNWYEFVFTIVDSNVYFYFTNQYTEAVGSGTLIIPSSLLSANTQFGVLCWRNSSSFSAVDIDYIAISFTNIKRS